MISPRLVALTISLTLSGFSLAAPPALAADCRPVETDPAGAGISQTLLDHAWSGTRIRFDAFAVGDEVLVGYYDADRWLTVTEFDRTKGTACSVRLDSQFGGWDSHNYITMALDHNGRLHVAGNMHAAPLVYARSDTKDPLDGLQLYPMLGKDESKVTYPKFLQSGDDLLFLYRQGGSGNGTWFANRWDGKQWHRLTPNGLFTDTWEGSPVSAYPSDFVKGDDGTYHVAVVWRSKPDAAANFAISYMKTKDFKNWTSIDNRPLALPMTPTPESVIEAPGNNHGLLNSPQISVNPTNQMPAIVYTRYDDDGANAAFVAFPHSGGSGSKAWDIVEVASAKETTPIEGRGTLPNSPRLGAVNFEPNTGRATVNVGFASEPTRQYVLSNETMKVLAVQQPQVDPEEAPVPMKRPDGIASPYNTKVPILKWPRQPGGKPIGTLRYVTQGPNNDLARECTTEAPKACDPPPTDLMLIQSTRQ